MRRIALAALILLLQGCAGMQPYRHETPCAERCRATYSGVELQEMCDNCIKMCDR